MARSTHRPNNARVLRPTHSLLLAALVTSSAAQPIVDVFVSGRDGYHTFRIPAIVRAADGALLAFAEGRRTGRADAGDIDLVCRRSVDGGATWGPVQLVADHGAGVVGNPVPIVDAASGHVVLVATLQPADCTESDIRAGRKGWRKPCVLRSSDHGATWSEPHGLPAAEPDGAGWRWYATGPGHGIQLDEGPHAGRMVVPANHSRPDGPEDRWLGAHLLLSDDGGQTWRVGAVSESGGGDVNANESTVAAYHDALVVSTRDQHGRSRANRAHGRSLDGGETFAAPLVPCPELVGPVCQGSLLSIGIRRGVWHLAFSGPREPAARHDLRVRTSLDGGVTWGWDTSVYDGPAAYSDLVALGGDEVGCLFEADEYARIAFRRFVLGRPHVDLGGLEPAAEPDPTRGFTAAPPSGEHHRVVDAGALRRCYPLPFFVARGCDGRGAVLSSPADLAMVEGTRDAVGRAALGRAVPVDVFLWAAGAPAEPWLTKIGGVPHREKDAAWPQGPGGEPMTFLAQWCFADSRDLFAAELPGEVLAMFVADEWPAADVDERGRRQIHFEWNGRELREPLRSGDLPKQAVAVPVLHGVRHRLAQYPDARADERDPFARAGFSDRSYLLAVAQATVIGTQAHAIQGHEPGPGEHLLCTLSSVQPNVVWPLVDRRRDDRRGRSSPHELMLHDLGCYYVVIDGRGRLRAWLSSY